MKAEVVIHRPDKDKLLATIEAAGPDQEWVMDTETNGLEVIGHISKHTAHYIGLMPLGSRHVFILNRAEFDEWGMHEVVNKLKLIGHHLRFDLHALDLDPVHEWKDTMIAAYFGHTTGKRSMDHIARMYGWPKIPTPDALKRGLIHEIPHKELFAYLADDCLITARMFKALQTERPEVLHDYAVDRAVLHMEQQGMRLIPERLQEVSAELEIKISDYEILLRQCGMEGNLNSSIQVGNWLIDNGRKLPYTPSGKPSTAKLVLQTLADNGDKLAQMLLDWRKAMKLRTSFIDPLPRLAQDGILYPRTNITRTATGRFSCDTPNLQQIPKRGPLGKAIRSCLTAREGNGVTACDFSQVELRVAAAFANEPVLLEAFESGRCPHTEVAARMLDKHPGLITPDERFRAKAVNFGILNGMGAKRLAFELKTGKGEAVKFLDDYKRNLPALHEWMEGVWREAEAYRIAQTVSKRTRVFIGDEDTRPAISVLVQGSAAELMRHALVAVDSAGLSPILSVHDEILIGGTDRAEELRETMESAAESAYSSAFAAVKFPASSNIGETWGDV